MPEKHLETGAKRSRQGLGPAAPAFPQTSHGAPKAQSCAALCGFKPARNAKEPDSGKSPSMRQFPSPLRGRRLCAGRGKHTRKTPENRHAPRDGRAARPRASFWANAHFFRQCPQKEDVHSVFHINRQILHSYPHFCGKLCGKAADKRRKTPKTGAGAFGAGSAQKESGACVFGGLSGRRHAGRVLDCSKSGKVAERKQHDGSQ